MKKIAVLFLSVFCFATAQAQVSTLNEDFNTSCVTVGPHYPLNWSQWNVIPPVSALAWNCTPLGGRGGTPGMQCNSYFSGVHYLDTAWLFTPQLDLSGYTDSIFLKFDSRYDIGGAKMQVLVNHYYVAPDSIDTAHTWVDMANRLSPVIGPDDSVGWVTHYVNLTAFKATPLYVAFRYASTTTTGGAWTIDNVGLTPYGLNVNTVVKQNLGLRILGGSTTDKLTFSCSFPKPGDYNVYLYDNIGRQVYSGSVQALVGTQQYTLSGLGLNSGIYFLKVGNVESYGVVTVSIQ